MLLKFPDLITGALPYFDSDQSKIRTLLVLACDEKRGSVVVAKVTSSEPRIVYSGQFAIYTADSFFKATGLRKDSKVDFNNVMTIPLADVRQRIGHLDLKTEKEMRRMMAAIKNSANALQIAEIGRAFG